MVCANGYESNTFFTMKEITEGLEVKRDEVTIASVDAINMYPSIKLATIRKEVMFFSRKLTASTKNTFNPCLEIFRHNLVWRGVLGITQQRKGITRVRNRRIRIGVPHQPGCVLPV